MYEITGMVQFLYLKQTLFTKHRVKHVYSVVMYILSFKFKICFNFKQLLKLKLNSVKLMKFMQSVPITTKVVSLNPTHGKVYEIQHYVIKFVSDLQQVSGFLWFPPPIKLTHDITEIFKHHEPNHRIILVDDQ